MTENYYCPLAAEIYYLSEYGEPEDISQETGGWYLVSYEDEINDLIAYMDSLDENNLAEYFDGSSSAASKLRGIYFGTENVDGVLYGCIRTELTEAFTPEEESEFREFLIGQCSDGYGESLEQRPIDIGYGNMYVSFWNGDSDYFMLNEEEFNEYRADMEMGGMS